MKIFQASLIVLTSVSLLLGACNANEKTAVTKSNTTTEKTEAKSQEVAKATTTDKPQKAVKSDHHDGAGHGGHKGQVVQSGKYHFEFNPDLDKDSIHLDTNIHGESDKAITNAKLVAQVQSPDGTSQTLPILYNAKENQYTAKLPVSKATGDYKVAIQAEIDGEKINTRFSFKP
jgi:hypothetical protein